VNDISLKEPEIEDIVKKMYREAEKNTEKK
jgi:hypothetical protein